MASNQELLEFLKEQEAKRSRDEEQRREEDARRRTEDVRRQQEQDTLRLEFQQQSKEQNILFQKLLEALSTNTAPATAGQPATPQRMPPPIPPRTPERVFRPPSLDPPLGTPPQVPGDVTSPLQGQPPSLSPPSIPVAQHIATRALASPTPSPLDPDASPRVYEA